MTHCHTRHSIAEKFFFRFTIIGSYIIAAYAICHDCVASFDPTVLALSKHNTFSPLLAVYHFSLDSHADVQV